MAKLGFQTFSIEQFKNELDFKTKAMFFDKIFIHYSFFQVIFENLTTLNKIYVARQDLLKKNFVEIEYLLNKGIVCEYRPTEKIGLDTLGEDMKEDLIEFRKYERFIKKIDEMDDVSVDDYFQMHNLYFDYITRFSCRHLSNSGYGEVTPLLASPESFLNRTTKQEVLFFTLNKLPQPSSDTSWEQIIDFKSDPDSKLKYLALINWINKTASSNLPINEVEDEYEYLYHQYKRHFEFHKIKTQLTKWEMIVAGGLEVLAATQGLPTFFKNLFSIGKTRISLLEDEMKLPGQEIAYIHKANQAFK